MWEFEDDDTQKLYGIKALFENGDVRKPVRLDSDYFYRWNYAEYDIKTIGALQRLAAIRIDSALEKILFTRKKFHPIHFFSNIAQKVT